MTNSNKHNIGPDGVRRDFYVYAHKDCKKDEVFYIGKGCGRRAWENSGRNPTWHEKVNSLNDDWKVEILKEKLTENEAIDLERNLIAKYGGAGCLGGTLTNWFPSDHLEILIPGIKPSEESQIWRCAYLEYREFEDLNRKEQNIFAKSIKEKFKPIYDELFELEEEALDSNDDKLEESLAEIPDSWILDECNDLIYRRISWKEFCLTLDELIDDIQFSMDQWADEMHKRALPYMESIHNELKRFFLTIDSGNKKEAEEFASWVVEFRNTRQRF